MILNKQVEIFCGTGGVGKTTLAASRALYLARQGKKVLLMTIDPSLRLKQLFNLKDHDAGSIMEAPKELVAVDRGCLNILLMNNESTLKETLDQDPIKNHILATLSMPYSGMNEILSLIELQKHIESKAFDHIVLDTPPGKHFIDFIQSAEKIKHFFDKSFVRLFLSLGESNKSFFSTMIEGGIKKVLTYLEKVTGESFVETFIDALITLFKRKDFFLAGLRTPVALENQVDTNWFLVFSVEQQKSQELKLMGKYLTQKTRSNKHLVINKSLKDELHSWNPKNSQLIDLKESMLKRENALKVIEHGTYDQHLFFPEIIDIEPKVHMEKLCDCWHSHELIK